MISAVVLQVLKTSLFTSLLIGILLLLVPLLQKRYRAKWRYIAWIAIAVRLLIPVNLSLPQAPINIELPEQVGAVVYMPSANVQPQTNILQDEGIDFGDNITPEATPVSPAAPKAPLSPMQITGFIWLAGVAAFLLFQICAYQLFLRKLRISQTENVPVSFKETVWKIGVEMGICKLPEAIVTNAIDAPVLIGVLHPRVLLPHIKYSGEELAFILRHELVHYRRRDMWYKLVLMLANALHWFNPLIYLMTVQAAKDIELACDDEVTRELDQDARAKYGDTILAALPRKRRLEPVFSTHFGSTKENVKGRLRNMFDMAVKQRGIAALCAVVVCALTLTGFVTFGYAAAKPGSIANRTDSLIQDFAKYKPFGVIYDAEQDVVYYNGERVSLFVEFKPHNEESMTFAFNLCYRDSDAAGTLYLEAVNDGSGKLIEIRRLNNEVALDILDNLAAANNQNKNDIPFVVMDATSVIESYGITSADLTKDKITSEITSWIGQCDKKQGAYILKMRTGNVYTTYIYYNGGGRYPWNIGAENSTISVRMYSNSNLSTTDGYYLMYFTSEKDYTDIHLYLDGSELSYEVNDRIILPAIAYPSGNFAVERLGQQSLRNGDTLKTNLSWDGKGNVMLLYTERNYTDDELLVSLQGLPGIPKPDYDKVDLNNIGSVLNFSQAPNSPLKQEIKISETGSYYFYIVRYGFDTFNRVTGEVNRVDTDGDIYGIWGAQSEAVSPVQEKPPATPDGNPYFQIKSNGKSILHSGSFEAKAGQTLTITSISNIKGGTVDFHLFSPAGNGLNETTTFTFGGSNATKTIKLSAGRWAYNCTGFFDSGDITIIGKLSGVAQAKSTAAAEAAYEVMRYSRSWMMVEYMLPYMTREGIDAVVKLNNELNPSSKKTASDYYGLTTPSKTETNQRSYTLMEKSGNWTYSSPLFPYMTNEGIERVVALYNQKTGKSVKATDYYNR